MCGISGIAGSNWRPAQLDAMVAAMAHRGPNGSGTYVDPDGLCGLGHNRLSIIDLSTASSQPMVDESGSLWLAFNGEIYNYLELQQELSGYPFRSRGDSETILAAYRKWGEDCVDHFIGMFAFAIWDERRKKLFCARDHLGIKPFNYTVSNGNLLFASEVKALLAAGVEARPDWRVWASYFQEGLYDHGDGTFFEGVKSLRPGHVLTWQAGEIRTRRYWDVSPQTSPALDLGDDEAADRLETLIADAVRLQLRSDVPLGVNLSGGLDSSALFAFVDASDDVTDELNCFTSGYDDPAYDETEFAAGIPRRKSWHPHVARLDAQSAWDMIDPLMRHEEAPFGGIGTLAYYNLHRLVREQGVTVVLEGQGMDEMFAGYAYYRHPARHGIYQDGSSFLRPETLSPFVRAQPNDIEPFPAPCASALDNRLYQDIRHTKLPRVLRMNDRLSMAFGLELRPPFLDHRVVEFAFRLRDDQKLRGEQGKFIQRHMLRRLLPDSVTATPKRAVVTPQREWIRGPLRPKIEELIHSEGFRHSEVFDHAAVVRAFDDFCAGDGDNAFFIWQWINFDAWQRNFCRPGRAGLARPSVAAA
jgi:asparagine synthase (glutamine-hydrolysing)